MNSFLYSKYTPDMPEMALARKMIEVVFPPEPSYIVIDGEIIDNRQPDRLGIFCKRLNQGMCLVSPKGFRKRIKKGIKKLGLNHEDFSSADRRNILMESTPSPLLEFFLEEQRNEFLEIRSNYDSSTDLHKAIEIFHIDKEEFWFAILWLMDYIASLDRDLHKESSDDFLQRFADFQKDIPEDAKIELKLSVSGKNSVSTTNPHAIRKLGALISLLYNDEQIAGHIRESDAYLKLLWGELFDFSIPETELLNLPTNWRLFIFHKYMKRFLMPYKADRSSRYYNVASHDRELLISMVCLMNNYIHCTSKDQRARYEADNHKLVDSLKGINTRHINRLKSVAYMK